MTDSLINVTINQQAFQLTAGACLRDAVQVSGVKPPFAAAVNLQFVPKSQYETHRLQAGDRIELISPITGG
jgi:sulfur carrier protein